MKNIRKYLVKKCKFWKSKSAIPYADELTVFINVNIANLKDFSKLIPLMLKIDVRMNNEIMNIIIVKKYLLISLKSKLILENINLFINIFLGLLKDKIWLKEYFVNE